MHLALQIEKKCGHRSFKMKELPAQSNKSLSQKRNRMILQAVNREFNQTASKRDRQSKSTYHMHYKV